MNPTRGACEPDVMVSFLQGDLPADTELAFVEHLDGCPSCRQALDDSAGGAGWRQEVQGSLSSDEIDALAGSVGLTRYEPRPDGYPSLPRESHRALAEQALAALQSCLAPTDDPQMLGRIAGYEIAGVIGRGATGIVVKAFQSTLNRFVAIKLLAPELAVNAAARVRFEREAQAAAAVVHEHVVPIYAVDEFRGTPFLVMQYVSGGSLERRLQEEGILSSAAALRIGMQIASGLAAAHAQGLVHRDIKPANILLESGLERVLITDFGLARAVDDATLTHSGFAAGTPQFMSPEQARGDGIDHRTDLFSLGSVLYTLLAGRPPFHAETAYGLLKRICENPHRRLVDVNPTVPRWLSGMVDRLLAKEPEERFSDASEVARTLSACLAHLQNPEACELPAAARLAARSYRRGHRRRRLIGAGIALASCALGATAVMWGPAWLGSSPISSTNLPDPQSEQFIGSLAARVPESSELDRLLIETQSLAAQLELSWSQPTVAPRDRWLELWQETSHTAAWLDRQLQQESESPLPLPLESAPPPLPPEQPAAVTAPSP